MTACGAAMPERRCGTNHAEMGTVDGVRRLACSCPQMRSSHTHTHAHMRALAQACTLRAPSARTDIQRTHTAHERDARAHAHGESRSRDDAWTDAVDLSRKKLWVEFGK